MLLITMNEVTNLNAYLRYFVPVAALTIHAAGGQYLAAGEARSLSGQPLTRVVIVRFESMEQLQQWWLSPERQKAWKIGAKYARFRDIAVAVDVPPLPMPASTKVETPDNTAVMESASTRTKGARASQRASAGKRKTAATAVTKEAPVEQSTTETLQEDRNAHLFSYAETNLFFLEREKKSSRCSGIEEVWTVQA